MFVFPPSRQDPATRGFTLLELLVVITIIGLLVAVVLFALNTSRANSRDAARKVQLQEIAEALSRYQLDNGTFLIPGTGSGGNSNGFFGYVYPGYISIGRGLVNAGLMVRVPSDPLISTPESTVVSGQRNYMRYCGTGVPLGSSNCATATVSCVLASLEDADADDLATLTNSGLPASTITNVQTNQGMNYAACTRL